MPLIHSVHTLLSKTYPAAHSQNFEAESSSATEFGSFAMQDKHAALPTTALYWPVLHAVHGPPSFPVNPKSHLHAFRSVAAVTPKVSEFAGQSRQSPV